MSRSDEINADYAAQLNAELEAARADAARLRAALEDDAQEPPFGPDDASIRWAAQAVREAIQRDSTGCGGSYVSIRTDTGTALSYAAEKFLAARALAGAPAPGPASGERGAHGTTKSGPWTAESAHAPAAHEPRGGSEALDPPGADRDVEIMARTVADVAGMDFCRAKYWRETWRRVARWILGQDREDRTPRSEIAAAIRALPFAPDTHTGTRQGWLRENAARLVEGKEPLPWVPAPLGERSGRAGHCFDINGNRWHPLGRCPDHGNKCCEPAPPEPGGGAHG